MKLRTWGLVCLALLPVINCGPSTDDADNGKTVLAVTILPQKYFIRRIAGDRFDVQVMIPPGHSPATYSPTPRQMRDLARSRLYFKIGHLPFEKAWMANISAVNRKMTIIDTSDGIDLIRGETHRHGDEEHDGIDPHTWLSPQAVKIQARHIYNALVELDPPERDLYTTGYRAFIDDIDRLIEESGISLEKISGAKFLVFHPVWTYFARDFGLIQLPIEIEGKEPNPADLRRLIDMARRERIRAVFIQSQFDTHSAGVIAEETGARLIRLDPLAEDWLETMNRTVAAFKSALNKTE